MQRTQGNTVSLRNRQPAKDVPILVRTEDRHPDAQATFLIEGLGYSGLRVLRAGDFNRTAYKDLEKRAQIELRELINLRQGIIEMDEPSFWADKLGKQSEEEDKIAAKIREALERDIQNLGEPSPETEKLIGEARTLKDPLTYLSAVVSQKLSGARLVLWFKGQPLGFGFAAPDRETSLRRQIAHFMHYRKADFVPAIYCPDMETAFYVYALFTTLTGRGLGICQECGEVFQKERPDELYCCPSHADAFRVRRWRAEQKQKKGKAKSGRQLIANPPKGVQ